jgi:hypothetical protein
MFVGDDALHRPVVFYETCRSIRESPLRTGDIGTLYGSFTNDLFYIRFVKQSTFFIYSSTFII